MLNGLDLFSGIGGLSMALAPWVRPIAYCEIDRYCQAVLLSRMRDGTIRRAPIWDDVTTLLPSLLPRHGIDVIYGGPPCQDFSVAGSKRGLEGRRGSMALEMLRLVDDIRPSFVFLENVPGILSRGFWEVVSRLSALGYEYRHDVLSAYDMGAPHPRERVWLMAHAHGSRLQVSRGQSSSRAASLRQAAERGLQGEVWLPATGELRRVADGIRPGTHRIRALGNAVVPQCAREAFMRLMGLTA